MTSRRHRLDLDARERLATLMNRVRSDPPVRAPALPDDQEWVNATVEVAAPEPAELPPRDPWWRRGRVGQLVERWAPPSDVDPRRRTLALVLVGGLVVAVLVAVAVTVSGPGPAQEPAPALPAAAASVTSSAAAGEPIVVSVVGRVVEPGLVTLEAGARVADALRAAGGPVPGADIGALNLARRLTDGEQLYVGVPPPPGAEPAGTTDGGPSGAGGQVDLNTASLAELDTLPGVGPVTAERIVDWRERNGRFATVDQLREIEGIGPARFATLKELVVAR
jgi:competence protein ComEA